MNKFAVTEVEKAGRINLYYTLHTAETMEEAREFLKMWQDCLPEKKFKIMKSSSLQQPTIMKV